MAKELNVRAGMVVTPREARRSIARLLTAVRDGSFFDGEDNSVYPVFSLVGPPGHAKSTSALKGAADAGFSARIVNLQRGDITDLNGLPVPVGEVVDLHTFGWVREMMSNTEWKLYLFDEWGQATQALQAACSSLILDRQINGQRIPDTVVFGLTGNRKTDRAGSNGSLSISENRLHLSMDVLDTLEEWLEDYALPKGVSPMVTSYLRNNPADFALGWEDGVPADNRFPSSRAWRNVSDMVKVGFDQPHHFLVLGDSIATNFSAHLKLRLQLPNFEDIELGKNVAIPENPSVLMICATVLARRYSKRPEPAIMAWIEKLPEDYQIFFVKDTRIAMGMRWNLDKTMQGWAKRHQHLIGTAGAIFEYFKDQLDKEDKAKGKK